MIRLREMALQNFRCVSTGTITFSEHITVLVADNGVGKTTILDAAAIALAEIIDEFTGSNQSSGLQPADVRLASIDGSHQLPQTPTVITAMADLNGHRIEWSARRNRLDRATRKSARDTNTIHEAAREFTAALATEFKSEADAVIPVVAYYRSNRFALNSFFGDNARRRVKPLDGRLSGYRNYLEPLSDATHLHKWYRKLFLDVKHSPVTGTRQRDLSLKQLTAVNDAIEQVVAPSGWRHPNWDESQQSLTFTHDTVGTLPLALLSAGVRTTIAVVADVAHRCARLNPALGPDVSRHTPGVVLIDEVDLHLHPAWQQIIVELLHSAFPSIQFILSTHSPQVLSTVNSSAIRVIKLRDGCMDIKIPAFQTRGVVSADVLAVIMDVDPVPKVPEAQWLHDYRAMIEEGRHEVAAGVELRERLEKHFGAQHPLLIDCERLIRFTEFKRRRAKDGGIHAST